MNKEYIAQCADKELQKVLFERLKLGDSVYYYNPPAQRCLHRALATSEDMEWVEKNLALIKAKQPSCIITLTQEQLWAMLPKGIHVVLGRREDYYWIMIAQNSGFKNTNKSSTAEEALLKLVMAIEYDKTWDKGAWV